MFDCETIEARLSEYLDALLPPDERSEVRTHLGVCGNCRQLRDTMIEIRRAARTFPSHTAPQRLASRILAATAGETILNCPEVRERLSEALNRQPAQDADRPDGSALDAHLDACPDCREARDSMKTVVDWARRFPSHDPPPWLAARILADTPTAHRKKVHGTGFDALAGVRRWLVEPRTAMTVFSAMLVLSWMTRVAGAPLDPTALRNPSAVYRGVEALAGDVYDRSVQFYYGIPYAAIEALQQRIDRLTESAG